MCGMIPKTIIRMNKIGAKRGFCHKVAKGCNPPPMLSLNVPVWKIEGGRWLFMRGCVSLIIGIIYLQGCSLGTYNAVPEYGNI